MGTDKRLTTYQFELMFDPKEKEEIFYDPIKNQTYLNISTIRYFHEKGAQPI